MYCSVELPGGVPGILLSLITRVAWQATGEVVAPPLAECAGKKHGLKNVAGTLYSETVHAKCLLR